MASEKLTGHSVSENPEQAGGPRAYLECNMSVWKMATVMVSMIMRLA